MKGVKQDQVQINTTTWSQWGKAAVVFTLATGAYALSKAMGWAGGHTDRQAVDPLTQAPTSLPIWPAGQGEGLGLTQAIPLAEPAFHQAWDLNLKLNLNQNQNLNPSPLITLGTIALTLPRYPLSALSALSLSFIQSLPGAQAVFPATLDLASLTDSEGFVLQGAAAGDWTGYSVGSAGDVNGDGLADVLVGARYADPLGRTDAGVAYLLFGINGSWPALVDLGNLTSSQGVLLQGAAAGDYTGYSVSSAGDVNGDNFSDVLVGAYAAEPLGRTNAGVAYLLFGTNGSWPALVDLGNLTSNQGVVLQGAALNDDTGYSVSSAGDVNGDGLVDVLVGAPQADPLGRSRAGAAYLLFGTNGSWPAVVDLGNLTSTQGVVLQGAAAIDYTGYSVSSAGDVNGDGLADVLVGAYWADPLGRSDAGVAYLLFGVTGSWPAVVDLGNLTPSQGVVLQGAAADDLTGVSVSSAGDVNGDVLADVLVGAYWADPLGRNLAGVAYLLFGANGSWPAVVDLGSLTPSQGVVLQGAAADDRTSYSVSSAGDVNGDGLADVLVGANLADPLGRGSAGVAYLLFGTNGSWPVVIDLGSLTSSQGVVLQGASASDLTGYSVSSAGDVNGDGLADVLVGAYSADPLNRSAAGVAYVILGQVNTASNPTQPSLTDTSVAISATATIPATSTELTQSTSALTTSVSYAPTPETSSAPFSSSPSQPPAPATLTATQLSGATTRALTQNSPGFSIYSNSVLYLEIDVETLISTENLSVEGFTGDPSQLIFSMNGSQGVMVLVNGEESNQFTLFDLQSGDVYLYIDAASCENDLNSVEVEASDGSYSIRYPLRLDIDRGSCIYNTVSTLTAKNSLQGVALLLVSSGLGLLTRKRHVEKTKNRNSDNKVKEGSAVMQLSN